MGKPHLTSQEQTERNNEFLRERIARLQEALGRIAAGRRNGREPLAPNVARRIADAALHDFDEPKRS